MILLSSFSRSLSLVLFQVNHQCSTNMALQPCTRARVAARLPRAFLECLCKPIRKQHLPAPLSHWHRVYLNNSR